MKEVWRIRTVAESAKLVRTVRVPLSSSELDLVLATIHGGAAPASLESPELDFKRQPASVGDAFKTLVDAVVCFANAAGGTVVMGIANAVGGADAFLG